MKKTTMFRQCYLRKDNSFQTSWIPEKYAIKGKSIKLRDNGVWDDGWIVESVGSKREEQYLPDFHDDIKNHLKATGDSSKK